MSVAAPSWESFDWCRDRQVSETGAETGADAHSQLGSSCGPFHRWRGSLVQTFFNKQNQLWSLKALLLKTALRKWIALTHQSLQAGYWGCDNNAEYLFLVRVIHGTLYLDAEGNQRILMRGKSPLVKSSFHQKKLIWGWRAFGPKKLKASDDLPRWVLTAPLYAPTSLESWGQRHNKNTVVELRYSK